MAGLAVPQQGGFACGCSKGWGAAQLLWLMPPMMCERPVQGSTAHKVCMLWILGPEVKEMSLKAAEHVASVESIPIYIAKGNG